MLTYLRNHSRSFIVKVLLGLLVLSFGAWGIGDYISGGIANLPVAKVGKKEISQNTYARAINQEVNRFAQLFGRVPEREMIEAMQLPVGILQRLVGDALLDNAADALGLMTHKDAVVAVIREMDAFKGMDGQFSEQLFYQLLRQNGYTEASFIADIQQTLRRDLIERALHEATPGARVVASRLDTWQRAQRDAYVIAIDPTKMTNVVAPSNATIKARYEETKDTLNAPEYRNVTWLFLSIESLTDESSITHEEILAAWEERADMFHTAEERTVRQAIVSTSQDALRIRALTMDDGESFDDAVRTVAGPEASVQDLGTVTRRSFVDDTLAEAVFAAPVGIVSEPVQTALGVHLVITTDIVTPGVKKTLDDVRDVLRRDLARAASKESLYDVSVSLEDLIARGQTIEEAGATLGISPHQARLDAQGNAPQGEASAPLSSLSDAVLRTLARTAFSLEEGALSTLIETEDGEFILARINAVEPARPYTFAEVESRLRDTLHHEARKQKALELAQKIAAVGTDAASTNSLQQAAKPYAENPAVQAYPIEGLERSGRNNTQSLPQGVIDALFERETPGHIVVHQDTDTFAPAWVGQVLTATPATADAAQEKRVQNAMAERLHATLMGTFRAALMRRYETSFNQNVIEESY